MKPKIYVAGPMRGYPDWNFPAFDAAAQALSALGYTPVSPADLDRFFEGWGAVPPADFDPDPRDFKKFIRRDINLLLEFDPANGDAIYLLRGWEASKGAQVEKALADFLGLRVLYGVDRH